jgi:hypothetical protein
MSLRRIALKRLSASDLTFFASIFHKPGQRSKQKAINLNSDVFVDLFFPSLKGHFEQLHFSLEVNGPSARASQSLSRKAVRSEGAKNWRLNGELIHDPADHPGCYDNLAEGDYAILAFEGTDKPEAATLLLIAAAEDAALHDAINRHVTLSERQSMVALTAGVIAEIRADTHDHYEGVHPLEGFLESGSILEAVVGSSEEQVRVGTSNGRGPKVSPGAIRRRSEEAARVGQRGEELFAEWLSAEGHPEDDIAWVSQEYARAAFDFVLRRANWEPTAGPLLIDVKTTCASLDGPFHLSAAEALFAAAHPNYRIARIALREDEFGALLILDGLSELCTTLLKPMLSGLHDGVRIDSFELAPNLLRVIHASPSRE